MQKKEKLHPHQQCANQGNATLVETKSAFHGDKGEVTFYREISHPGSRLVQFYANVVSMFVLF